MLNILYSDMYTLTATIIIERDSVVLELKMAHEEEIKGALP